MWNGRPAGPKFSGSENGEKCSQCSLAFGDWGREVCSEAFLIPAFFRCIDDLRTSTTLVKWFDLWVLTNNTDSESVSLWGVQRETRQTQSGFVRDDERKSWFLTCFGLEIVSFCRCLHAGGMAKLYPRYKTAENILKSCVASNTDNKKPTLRDAKTGTWTKSKEPASFTPRFWCSALAVETQASVQWTWTCTCHAFSTEVRLRSEWNVSLAPCFSLF